MCHVILSPLWTLIARRKYMLASPLTASNFPGAAPNGPTSTVLVAAPAAGAASISATPAPIVAPAIRPCIRILLVVRSRASLSERPDTAQVPLGGGSRRRRRRRRRLERS